MKRLPSLVIDPGHWRCSVSGPHARIVGLETRRCANGDPRPNPHLPHRAAGMAAAREPR